ncbi:MAG: hypothetical protein ABSC06_39840 [Rhodopila sp.]
MKATEERIWAVLQERFPNNNVAPSHYGELLAEYAASGISPPHLVAEIETGDEGKLWSCIWEAMLHRHLRSAGYKLRSSVKASGQQGPDFCIEHSGQTIWIEAIVPAPEGIPADYLETPRQGENLVKSKPDQSRVLRCTSAIDAKQKKFAEYLAKGIVNANDCLVIAVNICRLSDWDIDGNGISQFPLVMEAVFPVGPLGVPITPEGDLAGPAQNISRLFLQKQSGKKVDTANFFDTNFAHVSAIIQSHQKDVFQKDLVLSIVHNPLALNPLPIGLFGSYKEFVAEDQKGGEYLIKDINTKQDFLNE